MNIYNVGGYLLKNEQRFDKDTFLSHLEQAYDEVEKEHPDRLKKLFDGKQEAIIPEKLFISKLCELFGYEEIMFQWIFDPVYDRVYEKRIGEVLSTLKKPTKERVQKDKDTRIKEQTYEEFIEEKKREKDKKEMDAIFSSFNDFFKKS